MTKNSVTCYRAPQYETQHNRPPYNIHTGCDAAWATGERDLILVYGGNESTGATHSITSSIHGGERSASRTVGRIHIGTALRTHLFGSWVGVTADLAVSEKRNIYLHLPRMALRLFTIAGLSSPGIKSNEVILLLILTPNSHRLSSRTFTLCRLLFTGCTNFLCLDSSGFILSIRTLLLR